MDPGYYVIDIDATLIGSHSEKEQAAPTYKRGFGFHPLGAWLDATGEQLAMLLRPGNAGSGTAADQVTVLDAVLAQLPVPASKVIARTDSAGCRTVSWMPAASARSGSSSGIASPPSSPRSLPDWPIAAGGQLSPPTAATNEKEPRSPRSPDWSTCQDSRPRPG
jgi:hypothetical protein